MIATADPVTSPAAGANVDFQTGLAPSPGKPRMESGRRANDVAKRGQPPAISGNCENEEETGEVWEQLAWLLGFIAENMTSPPGCTACLLLNMSAVCFPPDPLSVPRRHSVQPVLRTVPFKMEIKRERWGSIFHFSCLTLVW